MAESTRRWELAQAGLVRAHPEAVRAALFVERPEFFACFDKVQVKYEMLRAHVVERLAVSEAAARHGYSRASFYLVEQALAQRGVVGVGEQRPGRGGPLQRLPG